MSKIREISGFLEWLPRQKLVEDAVIRLVRQVYESFGFTPIETPAVELISTLSSKGVIDKEIYVLKRAKAEEDETTDLGLHFDLTVPFARYVAQHFSELVFPFKRYQLQKVWRGERPQKGRAREFYQFDIDTIAQDELPLSCDAEVITAVWRVFKKLSIGEFLPRINSRKILFGIYKDLGLSESQQKGAIVAVDKLAKIEAVGVTRELNELGLTAKVSERILELAQVRFRLKDLAKQGDNLIGGVGGAEEGIRELQEISRLLPDQARADIEIDLSLARGLDYYTGVIFELGMKDHPEYGTVAAGGRYENLASQFINKKLPGVGISIGITRLMELILSKDLIVSNRKSTSELLITVYSEEQRLKCNQISEDLRELGVNCEVYYRSPKLGKQIEHAEKKGIRYVMFIDQASDQIQIKDLETKSQENVSELSDWVSRLHQNN